MKVPVYEEGVAPERMPTPFRSAGDTAAGPMAIASGLRAIGLQAQAIREAETDRANAEAVQAAELSFLGSINRVLHDPQGGYLARRGANAITPDLPGSPTDPGQEAYARLEKAFEDAHAGLSNERQRKIFRQRNQVRLPAAESQIQRHFLDQADVAAETTFRSLRAESLNSIALNHADPNVVDQELGLMRGHLLVEAKRLGLGPDGTNLLLGQFTSEARSTVLRLLVDEDAEAAKAYLEAHAQELHAGDRQEAEKLVRVSNLRARGQRKADALRAERRGNFGLALADAQGIQNFDLRDEVENRLRQMEADEDAAQRDRETTLFDQADLAFRASGDHAAIPPTLWAQLPSRMQGYFLEAEHARRRPQRAMDEAEIPNWVWEDWFRYKQLAPAEKVRVGRELYPRFFGKITDPMFRQLVEEQETYRNELAKPKPDLENWTLDEVVKRQARLAGLVPWGGGEWDAEQYQRFARYESAVRDAVQEFQRKELKGARKPTMDEAQGIADRLLVQGAVPGGGFWRWLGVPGTTEKRAFEVQPGEAFTPAAAGEQTIDVPPAYRRVIVEELRRAGRPETEAEIRRLYLALDELPGDGGTPSRPVP